MPNDTKKDLTETISDHTGLTQVDSKIVIETFFDSVSKSLQDGTNIEIRDFARFKIKMKKARVARNPRTGDIVNVPSGLRPIFQASRTLRKRVNRQLVTENGIAPEPNKSILGKA